jgi:hypothetical protein
VEDARTQDGLATPFVTRIANSGHAYAGTARERVGCHVLWHEPDIEFNEKEFESFRSDVTVVTSVDATTITTLICVVATTTLYSFAAPTIKVNFIAATTKVSSAAATIKDSSVAA